MVVVPGMRRTSREGHSTFVPDPLPPSDLRLTPGITKTVEEAAHLLGQVEMCRTLLPNAELLIYSSLQKEALASSTIEGTIASPDELVRFQASHYSDREAVREVANYGIALTWGCDRLETHPITSNLILGLHERLLKGVRGATNAGRYKARQNYIGSKPTDNITQAVFVPPPPEDVEALLNALERYINLPNNEPRLVQCALAHYQFETIHPFHDGNGRVGRLLIILQMIQLKLLSAPLIYPSVYFERRRSDYYACLQAVRAGGAWNAWIDFFATGIKEQCLETIEFTRMILGLRQSLHDQIGNVRRRASLSAALDAFFHHPVLSAREVSDRSRMSLNAAKSALKVLEDQGVLYELSSPKRKRVYACQPVLNAIFGDRE